MLKQDIRQKNLKKQTDKLYPHVNRPKSRHQSPAPDHGRHGEKRKFAVPRDFRARA